MDQRITAKDAAREDADETILLVGDRMRQLRRQQGLTLQNLADQTNLSPGMLSLIERGLAKPSLWSLAAIAHALGLSLTDLIAGRHHTESELVTRLADVPVLETPDQVRRRVLKEDRQRAIDVTINEYAPGVSNSPDGLQHAGYEFGFVLEGVLTVEVEGVPHVLQPGDLIALQSTRRHRISNQGTVTVRALWFNLNRDS